MQVPLVVEPDKSDRVLFHHIRPTSLTPRGGVRQVAIAVEARQHNPSGPGGGTTAAKSAALLGVATCPPRETHTQFWTNVSWKPTVPIT